MTNRESRPCSDNVDPSAVSELFQTAALLLGNEQQAVNVVEEVVSAAESDPCKDPEKAYREVRDSVVTASLARIAGGDPTALDASFAASADAGSCVDSDDLLAAGVTEPELHTLIAGSGRARLRQRLERLPPALRAVFVLRAVLRNGNESAAQRLRESGAAGAGEWDAARVSRVFRQALCSLAASLVEAAGAAQTA